ncbi:MAG: 23S rRNA pseudouridine(2604) synthase RluF [Lachnospiraceae bacterium]|nr:23S rRNA pseudouridine(2604) synthase RluF [Lachnospiraceae bacterium]
MKPKKEFFTDEYDKKMKRLAGNDSPESKRKSVKPTEADTASGIRINKYMAESGMCSRREADKLVADGKVYIDGVQAVMGSKVLPGQKVTVKGQDIKKNEDLVLIAFNKPVGIVSTTDKREKDNIIDYINYGKRIFPIGRLDKESEGLILLTNDGDIVNKILRAGNYHEKEYVVTVNKDITPEFLKAMSSGVPILDTVTRPCRIEQIDKKVFKIILTQGLNRQIRRMCEALGYRVRSLIRIRIMNIKLNHLKSGTYRNLTPKELEELRQMIADSSNAPRRDASVVEE